MQALILASSSRYRRELLTRLGLPFTSSSPDIDESSKPGESAENLASRLAVGKARAVADKETEVDGASGSPIIIGSDQVACFGDQMLGKPGDVDSAIAQLRAMAGHEINFFTSVHVLCVSSASSFTHVDRTTAVMRVLSQQEVQRYVAHEPALDCAGSFKVEGLGISLFSKVCTDDPTALTGLPLIATCEGLRQLGVALP